jgi:hypothetical protein
LTAVENGYAASRRKRNSSLRAKTVQTHQSGPMMNHMNLGFFIITLYSSLDLLIFYRKSYAHAAEYVQLSSYDERLYRHTD